MDRFSKALLAIFDGQMSASQNQGLMFLIEAVKDLPLPQQAYVLATTFHETAREMQPIYERGAPGYFDKYEPHNKLGRLLGNIKRGDGFLYRGRGYVQLTGRANYAKAGKALGEALEALPDQALRPDLAARILIDGMIGGWFTGRKLSDYLGEKADYLNARRVVNGLDCAADIAGYAREFEAALALRRQKFNIFSFIFKLLGRD